MGLITKTIPGFYNGVSQQPASLRLDTQIEDQVNMACSIVDGMYKRPGTHFLESCSNTPGEFSASSDFVHIYSRDESEHYYVLITSDTTSPIKIFTLEGVMCEVRYGTLDSALVFTSDNTVKNYLTTGSRTPVNRYKACTVADYTFITNNQVVPAFNSTLSGGDIVKTVQTFNELPTLNGDEKYGTPTVGGIYKIQGDEKKNYIGYYLKYHSDKVYREAMRPGIHTTLNASTMPHRLVRTGVNQFTFAPCLWETLKIGDNDTNVTPSFIGTPIKNLFYYKTRLCFITKQSVCMSKFSEFFDFFPDTALEVLETDPIDLSVDVSNKVCDLVEAACLSTALVLFGKEEQFILTTADEALSPETATLTPTTSYRVASAFNPLLMGANVYFPSPKNKYISLLEYFVNSDTLSTEAADVTAHCPNYIPNGKLFMQSCVVLDTLFIKSSASPKTLYLYKFYWNGNEKVQSAWGKWTFSDEPIAFITIGTSLYFLFRTDGGLWYTAIMEMDVTSSDVSASKILLDKQVVLEGVYDSENGYTVYTAPYPLEFGKGSLVNSSNRMEVAEVEVIGNQWRVPEDTSSISMVLGENYTGQFTLSKFYLKGKDNIAITDAKYQIRSFVLAFTNTGAFDVEVQSEGYPNPLVRSYTGIQLGGAVLDKALLTSSEIRFMVMANNQKVNITIKCPSYLPAAFQSASMEVFFHTRGQVM
jgi:hypothetical protein